MAHHYDFAIIGDGPAARIAGYLTARTGARVLLTPGSTPHPSTWLLPSLHLDNLLKHLGGTSRPPRAPHIQIITDRCRLDINGSVPLNEELSRELPTSHQAMMDLFKDLQTIGQHMEQGLLQGSRLPLYGWRSHLATLPRRSSGFFRHLDGKINDPDALQLLKTLFGALCLAPLEEISLKEAALLWSSLQHPCTLNFAEFEQMLDQGLIKANVQRIPPQHTGAIKVSGRGPYTLDFTKEPSISADHLVVGDPELLSPNPFPTQATSHQICRFASRLPAPCVSPLLAPHIALDTQGALSLTLARSGDDFVLQVTWPGAPQRSKENVRQRLGDLLPFVPEELLDVSPTTQTLPDGSPSSFPRPARKAKGPGQIWLCNGLALYPRLGFLGETLCGFAAAQHLLKDLKK